MPNRNRDFGEKRKNSRFPTVGRQIIWLIGLSRRETRNQKSGDIQNFPLAEETRRRRVLEIGCATKFLKNCLVCKSVSFLSDKRIEFADKTSSRNKKNISKGNYAKILAGINLAVAVRAWNVVRIRCLAAIVAGAVHKSPRKLHKLKVCSKKVVKQKNKDLSRWCG